MNKFQDKDKNGGDSNSQNFKQNNENLQDKPLNPSNNSLNKDEERAKIAQDTQVPALKEANDNVQTKNQSQNTPDIIRKDETAFCQKSLMFTGCVQGMTVENLTKDQKTLSLAAIEGVGVSQGGIIAGKAEVNLGKDNRFQGELYGRANVYIGLNAIATGIFTTQLPTPKGYFDGLKPKIYVGAQTNNPEGSFLGDNSPMSLMTSNRTDTSNYSKAFIGANITVPKELSGLNIDRTTGNGTTFIIGSEEVRLNYETKFANNLKPNHEFSLTSNVLKVKKPISDPDGNVKDTILLSIKATLYNSIGDGAGIKFTNNLTPEGFSQVLGVGYKNLKVFAEITKEKFKDLYDRIIKNF